MANNAAAAKGKLRFIHQQTQRGNDQTGSATHKPCRDKVQPLQRDEQTDSGKKRKRPEWRS